ITYLTLHE
ncbi:unnamed protein product, partial [Allacma fusca]